MKKFSIISFFYLLFTAQLFAQAPPIKWGKIPDADLKMTVYEEDTTADAVILADFGTITFELNDLGAFYNFTQHKRIKILKQSAFDMGNVEIPYYAATKLTKVRGLKAQVFSPSGKKQVIGKKEIYDEEIRENVRVKKFACPKVEVGSIIEYKYQVFSPDLVGLQDWYFQGENPVRWSELRFQMPEWFDYLTFFQGKEDMSIREEKYESRIIRGFPVNTKLARYVMENAPSLRKEAYITTMDDYRARIKFQLKSIQVGNNIREPYLSSWPKFAETIIDHDYIGDQFNKRRNFKKLEAAAANVVAKLESPAEKVSALYEFIARNVEWNGRFTLFADDQIDRAFANRSANSSELNFMLLALLKSQGIEAYPLLLSTREHGQMITAYPIIDQFNHTMILAVVDGKEVFLDVGSMMRPMGYPRVSSLNQEAWLADKKIAQWVKISIPATSKTFFGHFNMDESGSLEGDIKCSHVGYEGMVERSEIIGSTKTEEELWQDRLADIASEVSVESVEFVNKTTPIKPLKSHIKCNLADFGQTNGDFIYISPFLLSDYQENPMKQEKRLFPVDFAYPWKDNYILNLTIPAGYAVEEMPEPVNLVLPNKGGKFTYMVSQNGDKVQVVSKISLKQLVFSPEEYLIIKKFFDLILEKQSEQLILKKKT